MRVSKTCLAEMTLMTSESNECPSRHLLTGWLTLTGGSTRTRRGIVPQAMHGRIRFGAQYRYMPVNSDVEH